MSRISKLEYTEINIDELGSALAEAVKEQANEVVKSINSEIDRIAEETLEEIKKLSPVYKKGDYVRKLKCPKTKKGAYRKGWTISEVQRNGMYQKAIHNKQHQLVHLLELGHLIKDGTGRIRGEAPAYIHVTIAKKHAREKMNKLLEELQWNLEKFT